MGRKETVDKLNAEIVTCTKCPRLVAWREKVAREKVKRFEDEKYWGRPVPGFGDPNARLLIVGLAPAAHGANRTGRMFTGDRSGDWLYRTLHKFGFANQPTSEYRDDGLKLQDCFITATLRCAPPQNKPTADEKRNCFPYLLRELQVLEKLHVMVALGKIGFDTILKALQELNAADFKKKPAFSHANEIEVNSNLILLTSYHPSQQNTFTGKLTEPMFDSVFRRAREIVNGDSS